MPSQTRLAFTAQKRSSRSSRIKSEKTVDIDCDENCENNPPLARSKLRGRNPLVSLQQTVSNANTWSSPPRRTRSHALPPSDDETDENSSCPLSPLNHSPRKRVNGTNTNGLSQESPICSPAKQKQTPRKQRHKNDENSPVTTPKTPVSSRVKDSIRGVSSPFGRLALDKPNVSAYQEVKQALQTSLPDVLLCRDDEMGAINAFINRHLQQQQQQGSAPSARNKCGKNKKAKGGKTSGSSVPAVSSAPASSLYISGAPGTGKTACLSHVIKELQRDGKKLSRVESILFINCMSLNTPAAIYGNICTQLKLTGSGNPDLSEKDMIRLIERHFTAAAAAAGDKKILLVLDEMDQLSTANQHVLYTIFEWPTLQHSRLILIGLANALDLTDRLLPKLESYTSSKPELINFPPYDKQQIVKIIQHRLQQTRSPTCLSPSALAYVAVKVSCRCGDLRRALDMCRRAVEVAENGTRKQSVLSPVTDNKQSPAAAAPVEVQQVGILEVRRVVDRWDGVAACGVAGGVAGDNLAWRVAGGLPLQHKVIVCTLVMIRQGNKYGKGVTLRDLEKHYGSVCKRHSIVTDGSHFLTICQSLEASCVISILDTKLLDIRFRRVELLKDEDEVRDVLGEQKILSDILSQGLPTPT